MVVDKQTPKCTNLTVAHTRHEEYTLTSVVHVGKGVCQPPHDDTSILRMRDK